MLKGLFLVLFFMVTAVASPALASMSDEEIDAAIRAGDKRYALLVGVGDYDHTVDVRFVEENLDAVETMLREVFYVPQANIRRITDPTVTDLKTLFGFASGEPGDFAGLGFKEPDAEFFVYFIGHGSRDLRAAGTSDAAESEGFLLGTDSQPAHLSFTAYSYDTLIANLDALKTQKFKDGRVVLLLESCFSGESNDGPLNPTMGPMIDVVEGLDKPHARYDVVSIAAAGADTPAYWDEERRIGLFTDALTRGLSGDADGERQGDEDGVISMAELEAFLARSVPARALQLNKSRQVPQVSEGAEGPLVRLASPALTPDPIPFETEFEIAELEHRLGEIEARDWPALSTLQRDIAEFMDRCGDACRPYLGRLIPLRNTVRQYATRCRAASAVARNRIRGGRFAPLKTFSDLCAKAVDVSRCVASRDATSPGCQCVVDPRAEGCGIDPDAVCAAGLADAASAARQSSSLAPLETYATAAADCLTNPIHSDALSAARVDVCQSANVDRERGPIPPGLTGCRWAEVLREKLARQVACADAYAAVLRARSDHIALAGFLRDNATCREVDEARDLMRGRVDAAVERALLAVDASARRDAARALGDVGAAFAPYITASDQRRIDDAKRTVARAPCFEAFEEARLGGEPALAAFVRERTDCGAAVDNARALMVELRCEADYAAVDTNDPRALFRFALGRSECRVEASRAQRQVDRLGLDCLSAAERSGGSDRAGLAKIIAEVETCQIGFSAISERFSAHASARLKALRAMEETLAATPVAPSSQSGWRGPSGALPTNPAPSTPPPATASTYVALFNTVDFFGSDIVQGGFKVRNETECAQRCFDNGRCRFFTYNKRARHCFIKSGYGHITSHPDALSGMFYNSVDGRGAPSLTVGGRNQILYNQDFRGNDIMSATLSGVSLDACQAACDRNTQCAAFSYIERMRQCWQKYAAGRPRRKSGVHSGRSRQGSGRTLSPSRVMAVD